MNISYQSIWNETTGTFVAVSEDASSGGKKVSSGTGTAHSPAPIVYFAIKILFLFMMSLFSANVFALPLGGVVAAGGASVSSDAGSMTINQTTQNVAINWQSFNIGQSEAVRFVQPNSSSIALNRVLGADPSSILGNLSANGKVFVVNPNGILFGVGAQVNVGGLVASTLNISDNDFMAGKYSFSGESVAEILNQGTINADGGYVALLGAQLGNQGVISARLGTVALAAGNAVTLDMVGDGLLNVTVNQGAVDALVQNGGLIQADGGHVLLTAQAAGDLLQTVVNNTGVIQARSIENHHGVIRLLGDAQSGTVNVSGTLDVSGSGDGQTGGSVLVTAWHVGLFDQATINASGDAGGGTVLIGGDYQGKNPALSNAKAVFMGQAVAIIADAITTGNGGKVVLWADEVTKAYGTISAHGGVNSGDGGLIETSGHVLDVAGIRIDASSRHGTAGSWLLDPWNITITGGALNGGFSPPGVTDTWTPTSTGSTVSNVDINSRLDAGTNVVIQTNGGGGGEAGSITVAAPILRSTAGALTTLTLIADPVAGAISVAAAISGSAGAPLAVKLDGNYTVSVSAAITTFGGDFTSTGTTFTNGGGAITTAGGKVDILHSGAMTIAAAIATGGGNLRITGSTFTNAGGTIDTSSGAAAGGTLTVDQSSTVTLSAPLISNGGDILVRVGTTLTDTTTINAGAGSVTIQPQGDATTIGVGTNTSTLVITNTQIGNITAGSLIIGRATGTAAINVGTHEAVNFGTKNVTIQQASGGITAQTNSITGSGAMSFIAGTGTFTNSVSVNTTGAISITADDVAISADIGSSTAGAVLLRPSTAAQPVNVSSIAAGLNITSAEVNFLRGSGANTGSLTIGSPTGTALMSIALPGTPLNIVGSGGMFFTNGVAMEFGGPVAALAPFAAQTTTGNITLTNTLTTTNGGASAIVLNAGAGTAAGTAGGGDIIIAGGTLGTGAGGRVTLFTGSLAGSTGLATLVGSGSGNFRYNSDETTTNYTAALAAATYAIYRERPTLTITAGSPAAIAYGTATPALTTALSGLQNGDTALQTLSTAATVAVAGPTSSSGNYTAGAHALTPSGAVDQLGYGLSYVNGTLTVTKLDTTVSGTRVYNATTAAAGANLTTINALHVGDTVSVTGSGSVATKDVGAGKAITGLGTLALASADAGNYNLTGGTLTVTKLDTTVSGTRVYNATTVAAGADLTTINALLAGDTVSVTGSGSVATKDVGAGKAITGLGTLALASADAGNYNLTGGGNTLTVSAKSLTVTATDATKTFGDTPVLSAFTQTGLAPGDVIDSVTSVSAGTLATASVMAGPYAITPSNATGAAFIASNYAITYVNGALTVIPKALTVTASNVSKTYGETPALRGFTQVGLVPGNTIDSIVATSLGTAATAGVLGGPYAIVPSNATGATFIASNYTIAYVNGALTVIPKALTVTASNVTKNFGETPTLSAFTTVGLVPSEIINTVVEASPGALAGAVAPGPYAITPSGATGATFIASNYAIAYVNGTLTVVPSVVPSVVVPGSPPVVASSDAPAVIEASAASFNASHESLGNPATSGLGLTDFLDDLVMPVAAAALAPALTPVVVLGKLLARVLTAVLASSTPAALAAEAAPELAIQKPSAPLIAPAEAPSPIYVAPRRAPKQDRN